MENETNSLSSDTIDELRGIIANGERRVDITVVDPASGMARSVRFNVSATENVSTDQLYQSPLEARYGGNLAKV